MTDNLRFGPSNSGVFYVLAMVMLGICVLILARTYIKRIETPKGSIVCVGEEYYDDGFYIFGSKPVTPVDLSGELGGSFNYTDYYDKEVVVSYMSKYSLIDFDAACKDRVWEYGVIKDRIEDIIKQHIKTKPPIILKSYTTQIPNTYKPYYLRFNGGSSISVKIIEACKRRSCAVRR